MTAPPPPPPPPPAPAPTPAKKKRRPVRENLEAFGIAILFAVLLKPLVIEAYMIPTSSMQPTMMGSTEAGVYDRLLVDKLRYEFWEPERWDIVVFRYPIRQNQAYVKRIVGVGGDRLRIACGNYYQLENGQPKSTVRKPADVQAVMWREVYPARRWLPSEQPLGFKDCWSTAGDWRLDGDDAIAAVGDAPRQARLTYRDPYGGLLNRIGDGYPPAVARAIDSAYRTGHEDARRQGLEDPDTEGVQDARLEVTLTPSQAIRTLELALELKHSGGTRRFGLEVRDGTGRLKVTGGAEPFTGPEFDFALPPGAATRVAFAHLDDELIAWRDGVEVARADVFAHAVLTRLGRDQAHVMLTVTGGGEVRASGLRLDRDQHWTLSELPPNHSIDVPPGHFFMMGDNTLQSADARDWTAITVGVTDDQRMVDPATPGVRKLAGNKRPGDFDRLINDENPVVVRTHDRVAFTDLPGEVYALKAKVSPAYTPKNMLFGEPGKEWKPPERPLRFVPREHVLGRPLLNFWPIWPLGPMRVGFLR
jgi:signal peptidase I